MLYIKRNGVLTPCHDAYTLKASILAKSLKGFVREGEVLVLVHESTTYVTVASSATNFNLLAAIGVPLEPNIVVTINAGVVLKGSALGQYGFKFGGPYTGKKLTLVNNGHISGKGGLGGQGSPSWDTPGFRGGDGGGALLTSELTNPLVLHNNGIIAGGHGGGAGGGYRRYKNTHWYPYLNQPAYPIDLAAVGARGGGGADGGFTNSTPPAPENVTYGPIAGDAIAGGPPYPPAVIAGYGGLGGTVNSAPTKGYAGAVSLSGYLNTQYPPEIDVFSGFGTVGNTGPSIVGMSKVVLANAGTLIGPTI